jgi:hypothetical protein
VYWSDVEAAMDDAVTRILYHGEDPTTVLNDVHNKIATAAQGKGVTYPPSS